MNLADFLLARIAEDEELARDTAAEHYNGDHGGTGCCGQSRQFLSAHAPARVLAECEAKRRIVELHAVSTKREWVNPIDGPAYQEDEHTCAICGWVPEVCETIKLLALPYADHPDYREEWRP